MRGVVHCQCFVSRPINTMNWKRVLRSQSEPSTWRGKNEVINNMVNDRRVSPFTLPVDPPNMPTPPYYIKHHKSDVSADTKRWINDGLPMVHRLRRWTNVKPTLIPRLVSAGVKYDVIQYNMKPLWHTISHTHDKLLILHIVPLDMKGVYLPLCKASDTPFHM